MDLRSYTWVRSFKTPITSNNKSAMIIITTIAGVISIVIITLNVILVYKKRNSYAFSKTPDNSNIGEDWKTVEFNWL